MKRSVPKGDNKKVPKIEHSVLTDKVHLLTFENQKDITSTFLRFQEHYESPNFKGKIFSLDEFKSWYVKNSPNGKKTGKFTYYSDWNGFNIPSSVLEPFSEGKFDPLTASENKLLNIFKKEKEPYYIIGVHKLAENFEDILKHETIHGLFFTNPDYRSKVILILAEYDTEDLREELRVKGYHDDVLDDEVNAYVLASSKKIKAPVSKELERKLADLFNQYCN